MRTSTAPIHVAHLVGRRFVVAAISVLVVGALAGCGSDDSTDTSSTATASASASDDGPGAGGGPGGDCAASGAAPTAPAEGAAPGASDTATVSAAVEAVNAYLATLSEEQTTATVYDYADLDTKRCTWSNFPDGLFSGRVGVAFGDLGEEQRAAALDAVESVLSETGYTQVLNTMAGDDQLATEGGPGDLGADFYHLVVFGTPSTDEPWTLQFGGHHLAVHVSVGGDAVSVSPHFSGAQPIEFTVDEQTVRPMGDESDDIFGVFDSLTEDQRATAELASAYDDIVMGPGVDTGYPEQEGLSYSDLDSEQQEGVKQVIADWVADAAPEIADPLLDLYYSQLDETSIGFTGAVDTDTTGAYMRIDGPQVWIEWINTDAAGFHYHTIYRDKALDYGTGAE